MDIKDKIFNFFFRKIMWKPYYSCSDGDTWVIKRLHIEFQRRKWQLRFYWKGKEFYRYSI